MRNPKFQIILGSLSALCLAACGSGTDTSRKDSVADTAARTSSGALMASACSGCHSSDAGAIASLEAYDQSGLEQRLLDYKSDENGTTVMHRLARGYSDADIALVSAFLSEMRDAT